MIVTHKISMDLAQPGLPCIEAVQDDRYSRDIQIRLTANTQPFLPPAGCAVEVGFVKSDGRSGRYDAMPDGTPAWELDGELLTVKLAPQVLTAPGEVSVLVTLTYGETTLSCFPIRLVVRKRPDFSGESENYISIARFLPQPTQAIPGTYLVVESVDDHGRVTAMRCVGSAGEAGSGGYYIPSVQVSGGNLVISYRPSQSGLPAVPSQSVPLGGSGGVHLGTQEPTDESVLVWIDPDGGTAGVMPVERTRTMTLDVGMDADGRLYVDAYNKNSVDAALGSYISDVDGLIGGEG